MALKLEDVRLTPYDETPVIPEGFKLVGTGKTKRAPYISQYSWYENPKGDMHEAFHVLAMAPKVNPAGYTLQELQDRFPEQKTKDEVAKMISMFSSRANSFTGWDLISDGKESPHFMMIWRDPRVHYVAEMGLTGDFSGTLVRDPNYIKKVPDWIAAANAPKPVKEPKAPKAPAAAKAPGTGRGRKKATVDATANGAAVPAGPAPEGGYIALYKTIPATLAGVEGATIGEILNIAVSRFIEPAANQSTEWGDDPSVKVVDRFLQIIDQGGLEAGSLIDFVTHYQNDNAIRAGLYRIVKDLAEVYGKHVHGAAAPVAATA